MKEIEQAEFDRLEATLDKSFGRPTLEKEEVEVEKETGGEGWHPTAQLNECNLKS